MINTVNAIKARISSGNIDNAGSGKYGGYNMTDEQLRNASAILKTGRSMGASERDLITALMTAMQESSLRNIGYGDRDSIGLFQQRPSQGWGTRDQIMNPEYASRKFFSTLFNVRGRNDMPLTLAAQAVQRSAHPMAYAKWEPMARALLMGGGVPYRGFGAGIDISNLMGLMPGGMGGWVRPAVGRVSSEYGMRNGRLHDGIDIANLSGTPLYAARAGVVTQTRWGAGVGNYTQIDHGSGISTGYAHQTRHGVKVGQMVQAGQQIGWMGNTGKSTGPHLHFRYYKNGQTYNPRTIMPQLQKGGYTLNEGLANLHPKETVLTKPLSSDLKEGLNKFSDNGGGGDNYEVVVDVRGAYIASNVVIEDAVEKAIEKAQRKKGRPRTIGKD
jgi:murein DD-endopeptidase MepM/ murein hydrolase activator NlpD